MRRSLILSTVLAVSTAMVGACTEAKAPETKPATPAPVATTTPVTTVSPDGKNINVNGKTDGKDVKSLGNDAKEAKDGDKAKEPKPPVNATPHTK